MDTTKRSTAISVLKLFSRAWVWWLQELQAVLPATFTSQFAAEPRVISIIVESGCTRVLDTVSHILQPSRTREVLAHEDFTSACQALAQGSEVRGVATVFELVIEESRCLVLDLLVPRAGAQKLKEIVGLELENVTPFRRDDVYCDHCVISSQNAMLLVRNVIARRDDIEPLITALRSYRLEPVRCGVLSEGGARLPIDLLKYVRVQRPSAIAQCIRWMTILAIMLSVLVPACAFWRQSTTRGLLEGEVSVLAGEVATIRKRISQKRGELDFLSGVRKRKLEEPSSVRILEEVTRLLPDDTWLMEFSLKNRSIQLHGQSRGAADLIGILSASHILNSAEFRSPIVLDPRTGLEEFHIDVKVE